ncbi:MAG: DMT family transporter [Mesorhizobium sp.]
MTAAAPIVPQNRAKGIALMIASALVLQVVDGLAKHLSADYSPLFVGWARYAVASLIVVPYMIVLRGRYIFPAERVGSHLLRTFLLVVAMTLYFVAISHVPLATAISAYFVAPVVAMAVSAVILKEQLTAARLISVGLGFAGAMVIVQPGADIDRGIFLALGAGLAYAAYMVVTRRTALVSDPLKTLTFQCVVGALLLTPQALVSWKAVAATDIPAFAGLGLFSLLAHSLLITAFRLAETSVLAPFVYVELIGAAVIGYFGFGEVPGPATVVGAALIVAAGLIVLRRRGGEPRP